VNDILRTGDLELIRRMVLNSKIPEVAATTAGLEGKQTGSEKPTQADILLKVADAAELFHTPEGKAFAISW
jgi:hypothetical protein